MKLRIEIAEDMPDEVLIRCRSMTDEVRRVQAALESAIGGTELTLSIGDSEYFIPISDILFFETEDGKVAAHTAEQMFFSDEKLYELEKALPRTFVRVSKSCIVNSSRVSSISKSLTGTGEASFAGAAKKAFVSRMYFKILKDTIYETRFIR